MPPAREKSPLKATSASGESTDWLNGQANQRAIGGQFLECTKERNPELHAVWGDVWLDIPEVHACARALYEFLVSFLILVYIIPKGRVNAGSKLGLKSAQGVFGGLVHQTKNRFTPGSCSARATVRACARACAHVMPPPSTPPPRLPPSTP